MIAIQVAVGIVLAYTVIVNQRPLLKGLKWTASLAVGLAVLVAMVVAGSAAWSLTESRFPHAVHVMATSCGVILFFLPALMGGYALAQIVKLLFGVDVFERARTERERTMLAGAMLVLDLLIVWAVSWPLLQYTLAGAWYDAIDQWSRAHGLADGLTMMLAAGASLWSVPVWLWLEGRAERVGHSSD